MATPFRKISSIRSLTGGTKWYLSDDCLLAAKLMMYTVEYRRFYLRDLESVVVWPSRLWLFRLIIPGGVLATISFSLWEWSSAAAGAVFGALALLWVGMELVLGPTAKSQLSTTGAIVDITLVSRTRRARKILARIDAAVRAARGSVEQPIAAAAIDQPARPPIVPATETNAS